MEKRLLLFFAVTFLLVSLWPRLFPPPAPPPPDVEFESPKEGADRPRSVADRPESGTPESGAPIQSSAVRAAAAEQSVVVETDVYTLTFSNRGARLTSARLKAFKDDVG